MTILESAKLSNNDNTIEFVLLGGSRRWISQGMPQ
jgi:hypothetical protein